MLSGPRAHWSRWPWADALQHGQRPLHFVLVVLTFVTGLVDAVTYLAYGHVFAANMTGNVIVLGFALGGAGDISATASVVSLAAFIVGAASSARLGRALQPTRQRWLLSMLGTETALLALAAVVSLQPRAVLNDLLVVGLLAVAMGMRIVTVRRLGVSDVSTTVLTSTLAGLAADALFSGAPLRTAGVRLLIVAAMLLGAAAGAVLLAGGPARVLGIAAGLLLVVTLSHAVAALRRAAP